MLGVNDRAGLALVRAEAQRRIHERHMLAGVTIVAPASTTIDVDVTIGEDTRDRAVHAAARSHGDRRRRRTVGPHSTLIDARVGDRVSGRALPPARLRGPRRRERRPVRLPAPRRGAARGRRGSARSSRSRTRTSGRARRCPTSPTSATPTSASSRTSAPGRSPRTTTATAKHRTTIGARVHGGVDTSFVAPVTVGDDAWTAAGSVVTADVPPGALAVARSRQRNVERYAERRRGRKQRSIGRERRRKRR